MTHAKKRDKLRELGWDIQEGPDSHFKLTPPAEICKERPHIKDKYTSIASIEKDLPDIFLAAEAKTGGRKSEGRAWKRERLREMGWHIKKYSSNSHYKYSPPAALCKERPHIKDKYTSIPSIEKDLPGIFLTTYIWKTKKAGPAAKT
ncbi:unnamed protein product, partial [Chrysoparadoxa australica]